MNLKLGDTQLLIQECREQQLNKKEAAYVLATAYWETNKTMNPVKEAYWLSEDWRKNNLRYYPWYGRGYVQLTWKHNYVYASGKVGADLVEDPEKAMCPDVAAKVLVLGCKEGWFTGKKLSDYINKEKTDYLNARRVVNGMDKSRTIATLAEEYENSLVGYKPAAPVESFVGILLKLLKGFLNAKQS